MTPSVTTVSMLAGMAIVAQCICALNHMTVRTSHAVRAVYISLLAASAGSALSPFYGVEPTIWDASLMSTVAAFLLVNQRRTYMVQGR